MRKVLYFIGVMCICCALQVDAKGIPVIYSTDLFQPPEDPDDHYDLAILASLQEELDVKAVIFDLSTARRKAEEAGIEALHEMSLLSNQPVPPYAIGLRDPMLSQDDKAEDQPAKYQKGVELILKTLRESDEKVVLFLVGSCRDFAVAYNRDPELLKQKVASVYVNAGNGPDGIQFEWNVMLDPYSYLALMNSGLPIYWSPCFSSVILKLATPQEVIEKSFHSFNTYFLVRNQAELLACSSDALQRFFMHALRSPDKLPGSPRNMWCTGPFLHAAGHKIYLNNENYIACSPQKAKALGISNKEVDVFQYEPVVLTQADTEYTVQANPLCYFVGAMFDKTGIDVLDSDGRPDCNVRLTSIDENLRVDRVVITNGEKDSWEFPLKKGSKVVLLERNGKQLDCFFFPNDNGAHEFTVYLSDGTQRKHSVRVFKEPVGPVFKAHWEDPNSPVKVFRYSNPEYDSIMAAVLSGMLKGL